ncbi:MAG: HAMP domain-containing sensor histidine kinase [Gemmatimonadota bacterium]
MGADNVIPWPGSGARGSDDAGDVPEDGHAPEAGDAPEADYARPLSAAQRAAADRLERLISAAGSEPTGESAPWHDGLELEAAWEVGAAVRRRLEPGAGARHSRLDAELRRVALAERERLVRHHRSLLVDVSHDLRSPLNSILFLADAIQSERSGPLQAQQRRQIAVLYTAAVTLVRLVNDLIDFARLGNGRQVEVGRVAFSVEAVLADVHGLVGPLVAHRGVHLATKVATEGLRVGDPQILSRVLLNLVANAVEAVESGGEVLVEFEGGREALVARVRDDRVGTDVDELRRRLSVTDGEDRATTRGWTRGLGLTICARLVAAAGGSVTVAAVPREGTAFLVTLPFPAL